jgi:hypothetical protein
MQVPNKQDLKNFTQWTETNTSFIEEQTKKQPKNWRTLENELKKPGVIEKQEKLLSLAYQLQNEIKQKNLVKDFNVRHEHMISKYEFLAMESVSLYHLGLMELLDDPKYKDIIDIFVKNRSNPDLIRTEMENLEAKDVNDSIKEFVKKSKDSKDPDVKEFMKSFDPTRLPNARHDGFESIVEDLKESEIINNISNNISNISITTTLNENTPSNNQPEIKKEENIENVSRSKEDLIKKYSKK